MSRIMCEERDAKCFIPENQVLVDNGAMIAWQGYIERKSTEKKDIRPYERTDDVIVNWN